MAALLFHSSQEHWPSTVTLHENNIINNNVSSIHHLLGYIPYTYLILALSMKAVIITVTYPLGKLRFRKVK